MRETVLVTGVTGLLGAELAQHLHRGGYHVVGCARAPLRSSVSGAAPVWQPVACDLSQPEAVLRLVDQYRPALIYHLAAVQAGARSCVAPGALCAVNVAGTVHLLEAVRAVSPHCRVVVAGSGAEYGSAPRRLRRCREEAPLLPRSLYAASKACATLMALAFAATFGLTLSVVRLFNLIGPTPEPISAPAQFAQQVAAIEAGFLPPVIQCGNLRAVRDFLDYRDAAQALALLADRPPTWPLYNLCSGKGVPLSTVLGRLLARSAIGKVRVASSGGSGKDWLVGDPTRLRAEVDWAPQIPLDDSLAHLLAHWRQQVGSGG